MVVAASSLEIARLLSSKVGVSTVMSSVTKRSSSSIAV